MAKVDKNTPSGLYSNQDGVSPKDGTDVPNQRGYWAEEITKAEKRYGIFQRNGGNVVDRYRLERSNNSEVDLYQDRYNILFSSTETTKPSLYAQTPKVQATKRHKDRENYYITLATTLMESAGQYAIEEVDFDGVMKNVVQDFLLPGLGQAWVRYEPVIAKRKAGDNDNEDSEYVAAEGLDVDYVYYKDFLTGVGRIWKELPWVARRVYFDKDKAKKRFGEEKANQLQYTFRPGDDGNGNKDFAGSGGFQSIIWEIWDKVNRRAIWFSADYAPDLLDQIDDPLKLKGFFPCPEPVRAVWTTRTFIPKAFYSQYKAQAEELDNITERIRYLTKALRVVGVYDGSQTQLQNILDGTGNKLVPVENWTLFAQQGGMAGSIQWLPIKEVAEVLMSLLQQRDVVKNEIYEITGFSDIQRGVTKASETLGAQEIKSQWATGRLGDLQKEIQRFCRDLIRIISEIQCEHFSEASWAIYGGFDPPEITDAEQAAAAQYVMQVQQYQASMTLPPAPGQPPVQRPQKPPPTAHQQAIQAFQKTVALIKDEKHRAADIGVETDSTLLPNEQAEREDRMQFLSSAGAFLQQAGPMALQYPDMRGLLGAILMFTIRTFRSSRPLEKSFEEFTKKLEAAPPVPPQGQGGDGGAAAAQASIQTEQIKQESAQSQAQMENETARYKIDQETALERDKQAREHEFRMAELSVRDKEADIKQAQLEVQAQKAHADTATKLLAHDHQQTMDKAAMAHDQAMDITGVAQQQQDFAAGRDDADRQFEAEQRAQAQEGQNRA